MNSLILDEPPQATDTSLQECVEAACEKIPPLWPLTHFVAVNPFVGMADLDFGEALDVIHRAGHQSPFLPASNFASAWHDQSITKEDLRLACKNLDCENRLPTILQPPPEQWPLDNALLSVADALDVKNGTRWNGLALEEISKWCAAYHDQGQSLWQMPWKSLSLFRAWKRGAELDRTPEVSGIPGFRSHIKSLPDEARRAMETMLKDIGIPDSAREDYFHRLLMSVKGWAGYVQYLVREKKLRGKSDESLEQLLAIRLAYDWTLHKAFGGKPVISAKTKPSASLAAIWQEALEISHRRVWIQRLQSGDLSTSNPAGDRPSVQAVFCIDVRSEVMRRALELTDAKAETIGFAGFFGFPIEVVPINGSHGSARCPVLLTPSHRIHEHLHAGDPSAARSAEVQVAHREEEAGNWKRFKTASITSFSFVESLGLASVVPLLRKNLVMPPSSAAPQTSLPLAQECCPKNEPNGLSPEDRVTMALGALRNMGLTKNFARLILLCGHGGQSANNPFASSLDCGACGGHAGDANARVAAAVLNDPAARRSLPAHGVIIPDDTIFLGALHNTGTDEITIFDQESVPSTHQEDLKTLQDTLSRAGDLVRAERAIGLGVDPMSCPNVFGAMEKRSCDWAEVRPEWGLAGNHAFIAAPRSMTKNIKLDGQAFLHNYDAEEDNDLSVLELILCAPMVVASWINLQYFGSASNNDLFGSGNKLLHNVVGKMGVLEGNGGDLRSGLPWQSVHDGANLRHTPLRLNVFVKASPEAMDSILEKHESVANLVNHRWIHLFALGSDKILQRQPQGGWNPFSL
ncbi:MAG: DUF2309 domain-containing protein [Terrimicrobiaceae bacterium]